MKNILSSWKGTFCIIILLLGLGTGLVYQHISHTSDRFRSQQDMLDVMNFNQQLLDVNFKLRNDIDKANIQIHQMDMILRQFYDRLRKYEPHLPAPPGEGENKNRSEA